VAVAQSKLIQNLQATLRIQLNTLESELNEVKKDVAQEARNLANFVEAQGGFSSRPEQLLVVRNLFSNYVSLDANKSFYLITDAQGQTVAQYIQEIQEDFSTYPSLPREQLQKTQFRPVSLPIGINLGDLPIVQKVLQRQSPLSGAELFKSDWLKRLGLDRQANIGIRAQKTQGLPEAKQPFPTGTYDIDEGKAGLAIVAVYPIRVQGKLVGTAIVGTLLNRNFEIVDRLKQEIGVSTATLFAQDWRVSTNVPYTDHTTRAIGTRVSREVAEKVLNSKQVFVGSANIIGVDYLTGYSPIYDHNSTLNPTGAKPVGIAYVGEPQTEVQKTLNVLTLAGWGFGGGIAVLAGLVAFPIARTFSKPLQRLANCAQQVGAGDLTNPVPVTDAQDEIGQLLASFQDMTQNLNALIQQVQKSGIQIISAATQIAASGKQLEATMSEQATSTNEVAATAKEIAATSSQLVTAIKEVDYKSQTTAQAATESQQDLMQMETAMGRLADVTSIISTQLGDISAKANSINSIITTITKIAAQTNLLSLNAAIEAEKAGEYGTGFAVVAREIRRLADQTAVATLDIENMVKAMQATVATGVMEIDRFSQQVKESVEDVHNISNKLESIIVEVQTLTPSFQQVSNSMEDQSEVAVQISEAMVQLSEASSQTAASLRQVNGAIAQLNETAQSLRYEVSRFKVAKNY
jgi:methyl-accepting chemotaxis protein